MYLCIVHNLALFAYDLLKILPVISLKLWASFAQFVDIQEPNSLYFSHILELFR